MKSAVIVFPGSNCDRDAAVALHQASGKPPAMVWHGDSDLPDLDLVVLPGGFSYGDYLRVGAIAALSPIMAAVVRHAERGGAVFAICNGFQMACEAGLLPGVLMNNAAGKYVCRHVAMRVEDTQSPFTAGYQAAQRISIPVAHHDGNYFADEATLDRLEGEGLVAFRYDNDNPNGSCRDIAGILSANRRVLGMMPHPERAADPDLGGTDGAAMFRSLVETLA
ncbi:MULTISPECIES: phosphoribosylformylglycinamidine synthase subunit PurQ [unclassified Minwuia]|jgi:phosphoribosylformylglycinamidine synthase subunit PurQ / glutaminase|uniref:phosphoribosylformylglycinamidine synthase subunit PurQ n=1 Tax=unclassified Minwuia TaxID=2618799 RepID=UPI00247A2223|nr:MULTISPECIES: phosphoribosylformylglycinamidine synthase subunit PurQ [unclassified Minwuia]